MKKSCLILITITFLSLTAYTQSTERALTFEVISEQLDFHYKPSYLIKNGIVLQERKFVNGKVCFQIGSNVPLDSLFFVLSDQEEHIYRINLGALINYGRAILTPFGEIAVISNRLIEAPNEENQSSGGVHSSSFRFPDLSCYTKERQLSKYGYIRWFFPTELLINQDTAYDAYLSQWYNEERYYRNFGHYPKEGFIDSIKMKWFEERAENLAGWYSEQLISLGEPILCNGYTKEVYRLTWSNNAFYFTYNPYCMRIEADREEAVLYCSYYKWDDCQGYQFYCDIIPLDSKTYNEFVKLVMKLNMQYEKPLQDNGGSNYIFEAFHEGRYHVVFRGKDENEKLNEIQQFLWSLSQLGENEIVQPKKRIE